MTDARTIETVRSWEIDFETDSWLVKPVAPGYAIGAGIYLMVPVIPENAQRLRNAIEQMLDGFRIQDSITTEPYK